MHMILLRGLLLLAASTQFITSDARSCTGKEDEKKTKTIIKNFNSNRNLFAQRDKHGTLGYGAMEGEVYEDQYWHFLPVSCEGSFAKSGPCYLIKNAFSNRRIYAESDKSGSKGVGGHTGKSVGQKWVLQESDCNGNKCFYIINAYSGRRLYAQRYDNGGEVGAYTGELYADQRWFIDVCEGCDRRNYQEGGNSIGFSYFRLPFCSFCKEIPYCQSRQVSCSSSSNQTCGRCKTGYHRTQSNQLCSDACPNNKFGRQCQGTVQCLTDYGSCNKDNCWNFNGDGTCTLCRIERSGKKCEHNVCRDSQLGKDLSLSSSALAPSDFDFHQYRVDDLNIKQESQVDGDFGLLITFRPNSADIKEHRLIIDDLDSATSSSAMANCQENDLPKKSQMPFYVLSDSDTVGTKMKICLRGIWKANKLKLTSGSWEKMTEQIVNRGNPEKCEDYIIEFQTRVTISVRDIYNTIGVESATIEFEVAGHSFIGITGRNGKVSTNINISGLDPGTESAPLIVKKVSTARGSDFDLCLSPPFPGSQCDESQQKDLPMMEPIFLEHLSATRQEILIVDKSVVRVAGRVYFSAPSASEIKDYCGLPKVHIFIFDARQKDSKAIFNTTTTDAGEFEFAIPRETLLRLEINYGNHTLEGTNQISQDILTDQGFSIQDNFDGLEFKDITTSTITITSAVTECMFDIGNYDLNLNIPSCAAAGTYRVPSNGRQTYSVTIPAHSYDYSLSSFDGFEGVDGGSILNRFNFMFPQPERKLNLTESPADVEFIFHPQIDIVMEVSKGLYPPETFSATTCSNETGKPFNIVLEGNSPVALHFEFVQNYMDKSGSSYSCNNLPEGSTIKISSNLGQPLDPCAALTGGCKVNVTSEEYQGFNISMVNQYIFSGSPTNFGTESAGKKIQDYVGSNKVEYQIFNSIYFPNLAGEGNSKVLILGHKPLTEDSLVSFFSEGQDHIPLLYLNSLPAGTGTQSITFDLGITTITKNYAMSDISVGGGAYLGVKNKGDARLCVPFVGCTSKLAEGEQTFKAGIDNVKTDTTSYTDSVNTEFNSEGLTLTTPEGLWGKEGDMVLLIGMVAKFITAISVSLDKATCMINERPSTVWGTETESLLFYSRNDCEIEYDKLEKTIRDNKVVKNNVAASKEEKEEAMNLINISKNSKNKWNALFQHWEDDRRQARNHKINLRNLVDENKVDDNDLHTFTLGSSSFSLSRIALTSDSSVLDYTSTSSVLTNEESYSFEALFGVQLIVGPVGGGHFEYTSQTETVMSTTKDSSISREFTANFVESDAGDKLCAEAYKSPHSGTYIFEVCGGETKCPHILGTDARENIRLNIIESPKGILQQDSGRIVMEIDTLDMAESLDNMDVVLELDASTALFPVRFDVGSASLNQPLEFSVQAKTRTKVYIMFERLDPNLKSIQISGSVHSKCDESIMQRFSFKVEWSSRCPQVHWGGDLTLIDGTFEITSKNLDLGLIATNPTGKRWRDYGDTKVVIAPWYRQMNSLTESWREIPGFSLRSLRDRGSSRGTFVEKEDSLGSATLWLSADDNDIFRNNGIQYEFELRSQCLVTSIDGAVRKVGETRSGPRAGIVDLHGPKIISWAVTQKLNAPTLGFPICKVMFDEAIDCSHPSLKATIKTVGQQKEIEGGVYCTGRSQQLNVVLQLESQDDVTFWNEADIDVEILGVQDIHGNQYGNDGRISSTRHRFLKDEIHPIRMNFTTPSIPNLTGVENPWIMPDQAQIQSMLDEELQRSLPLNILSSSHIDTDDEVELTSGATSHIIHILLVIGPSLLTWLILCS